MSALVTAVVGSAVVGAYSARKQSKAAGSAAQTQSEAAAAGVDEQRRQFDAIQKLLKPYVKAGKQGLGGQMDLLGLNGGGAQQAAIEALRQSPAFKAQLQQGENSILQNASATGGLRGGNVQSALAQFSPQLLAQTINDQYSRLGGITSLGQNAAVQQGNAGMQTGGNIANLLQQQGAAVAGGQIAQGQYAAQMANVIPQALGTFVGLGGRF